MPLKSCGGHPPRPRTCSATRRRTGSPRRRATPHYCPPSHRISDAIATPARAAQLHRNGLDACYSSAREPRSNYQGDPMRGHLNAALFSRHIAALHSEEGLTNSPRRVYRLRQWTERFVEQMETRIARASKITQQQRPTYACWENGHCDALLRKYIRARF